MYRMQVERLNGFEGEIVLQAGDQQNRDASRDGGLFGVAGS